MTLNAGEIHQIGFRLAKALNISSLYAVDYRDSDFPFDSLVNSAKEAGQYNLLGYIKTSIDSIQNEFNESLKKNTLRELLLNQNSKIVKEFQVGAYFDFLVAGKKGNHVGSYLTSEWWRRNMIIYENILKELDGKEKKILVIFGSGHTALLHEMMKYNNNFELVSCKLGPVNKINLQSRSILFSYSYEECHAINQLHGILAKTKKCLIERRL